MRRHPLSSRLRNGCLALVTIYLIARPLIATELVNDRPLPPTRPSPPSAQETTPLQAPITAYQPVLVPAPPHDAPASNQLIFDNGEQRPLANDIVFELDERQRVEPPPTPPNHEWSPTGTPTSTHTPIEPAQSASLWWLNLPHVLFAGACAAILLLAGPQRWVALRRLCLPFTLWAIALAIGIRLHGLTAQARQDLLALAGGPLVLGAATTSWGLWRRRLLWGLLITAACIGALAAWQSLVILPQLAARSAAASPGSATALLYQVAERGRALGTFTLPILLGAYGALIIPSLLHTLTRATRLLTRVGLWVILLAVVVGWLLTRALGAWGALTAACAIVWLRRGVPRPRSVIGAVALLCCGWAILGGRSDLWNYTSPHHPVRNRLIYWDAALHLITTHPLIGIGPGRFGTAYRDVATEPQRGVRHAHNSYLQIWAEWGMLGLIGWCWLIAAIVRRTASQSPWLAVAVWVLPLCNLFDFSFYIPQVSFVWWYLAGWSFRTGKTRG